MQIIKQAALATGEAIAIVETSTSNQGSTPWARHYRTRRLVRIAAGAVYASSRSKGVSVLREWEYDSRSKTRTQVVAEAAVVHFEAALQAQPVAA